MTNTLDDPAWAVTSFSFTNDLFSRERTPDELVRWIAGQGFDAIEVDASQHFPGYPRVSDAEIEQFLQSVESTGFTPTMFGGYVERGIRRDRLLTLEESVDYVVPQVRAAGRMGFFGVRMGLGAASPELLRRLVPHLEDAGVRLLQEVQGGARPDAPAIEQSLQLADELGTSALGFVFDASLVMAGLPWTWLENLRQNGVPEPTLQRVEDEWRSGATEAGRQRVLAEIANLGVTPAVGRRLLMPFGRFGCTTVADWTEFLPHVDSVHLKYWDLDDTGDRVSGPIADLRRALGAIGYDGYICSEWGGHDWFESADTSALTMTEGHIALYGRALD